MASESCLRCPSRRARRPGEKEPIITVRRMCVNDYRMFWHAIRLIFELEPDLTGVAEAGIGEEARATELDGVLLDVNPPDGRGIDLVRGLFGTQPAVRGIA